MGSKSRVAKYISPIIQQHIDENNIKTYIEPFVGGSNMMEHIKCDTRIGVDNNMYLVEFMKSLQSGWNPLDTVNMTRELYNNIKDFKNLYAPEMVALAGLCATYNAKWFGGYAGVVTTKIGTTRNYYDEAVRNVLKQIKKLKDVHYYCESYVNLDDLTELKNCVIYCDPPYEGTTKYKDDFLHERYWIWVREVSKNNIVLCSEYNAPKDFECIWNKELITTLDKNSRTKSVEKLFRIVS